MLPEGAEEAFAQETTGLQASLVPTPILAGGLSQLETPPSLTDFGRSPIDPGRDNIGALRQHLADATAAAMTTVANNADDAIVSAHGAAES